MNDNCTFINCHLKYKVGTFGSGMSRIFNETALVNRDIVVNYCFFNDYLSKC